MKGYWDEPEKTAEVIDKNGWFKTGDVCSMDEENYLYFKSRSKEIVIRGGTNIYPAELERFLRTNEHILDCYAFGIPDEKFGEELCCWIKLKPESVGKVSSESIVEFCRNKIAYFKVPKHIRFVDSFPINATGKVQKFKMTQLMLEQIKNNP
jgi:fatty-acyl-CoA synthase